MIREGSIPAWLAGMETNAGDIAYNHRLDIAASVHTRMRELNITQAKLAEIMGVDQGRISRIITGKQNITIATMAKLEESLGFRLDGGFRYGGKVRQRTYETTWRRSRHEGERWCRGIDEALADKSGCHSIDLREEAA